MTNFKGVVRIAAVSSLVLALTALAVARSPQGTAGQATPPAGAAQGQPQTPAGRGQGRGGGGGWNCQQPQLEQQWRAATEGRLRMEKTKYKSRVDGLEIPAYVFQPLTAAAPKTRPALVWVHPDIRGCVYAYYVPYVLDAVSHGYVVVAPDYRGSVGYDQAFYDAIDYGGAEVDDVVTAVSYIKTNIPSVDPERIGIIGWSHGGMITLLSITREPTMFKAAAALVPVTNLFQRLAWNGVESRHQAIDPANRYGGLPGDRNPAINQTYKDRSPVYQIDKLRIPLLVHITKNDNDVIIEECMQLVDALRARKPDLTEWKIYDDPKGRHLFDRQVDPQTLKPEDTHEQRDSWNRVWTFFEWNLDPLKK